MPRLYLAWLCSMCLLVQAEASWRHDLPDVQPVGQGAMRWFGLKLYDAELYTPTGRFDQRAPHALRLRYARSLKAERIVEASLDQMQRLGAPAQSFPTWAKQMRRAFIDVDQGDTLTGVHLPGKGVRFYAGEQLTASIDDPEFARWFFAIWLDPATSEPGLRRQLIGEAR
ncbi:chalcone isomerase family protein [Chitinimonas sp. BJYL2]|uniref:chalcone isomerase family protein n=1 Tax=Chitinimonas sp. BJYL2 TaxID=2976696 RepID=UPI0022B2E51E|nr:chalcone isomerase family protein [Chitinimonas sp. BJYL2]